MTSKFSLGVVRPARPHRGTRRTRSISAPASRDTLNRESTGYIVTAKHQLDAADDAVGEGRALRAIEFPYSPERDTDTLRVMPGIEFKPRALVVGSAFVGFRRFTPKDPAALPEFTGLVANLGLSYTLLGATTFGVSYARDVNYSFEEAAAVLRREQRRRCRSARRSGAGSTCSVSADRASSTRIAIWRSARSRRRPSLDAREDTTWNYAGSIGYRPDRTDPRRLRRLVLGARVHHPSVPRLRRPPHRDDGYLRVLVMQSTQILRQIPAFTPGAVF